MSLGVQSSAGYGGGSRDVHYHISKARGISSARLLKCVRTRFERSLGFEDVKRTQVFCRRILMASHWLHMAWNWVIIKRDGHSYVRPKIFLYTACAKLIFFIRRAQFCFIYGRPKAKSFLYTASQSYAGPNFFYIRQAEGQTFFYIRLARATQALFFYIRQAESQFFLYTAGQNCAGPKFFLHAAPMVSQGQFFFIYGGSASNYKLCGPTLALFTTYFYCFFIYGFFYIRFF